MSAGMESVNFAKGLQAYEADDPVTALRWWLRGVDEDDDESFSAVLQTCGNPEDAITSAWNSLVTSLERVHNRPALAAVEAMLGAGSTGSALLFEAGAMADWEQFGLSPQNDLEVVHSILGPEDGQIPGLSDPAWVKLVEVLEESDIIVSPLGVHALAGRWTMSSGRQIVILFAVEPAAKFGRKYRVFAPLLIGLPDEGMAPNLAPDSPLAQAGFPLPLRPMQVLFARACLDAGEKVFLGGLPLLDISLRFGSDLPTQSRPQPRVAAGPTRWIMGPEYLHRLREDVPQITIGYDIDASLSGTHLQDAVRGTIESLTTAIDLTSDACTHMSGLFCEFVASIPLPLAVEQWDALFAPHVLPSEVTGTALWADMGLPTAMYDLGTFLADTPGLEDIGITWFDRAAGAGYAPARASQTWSLLNWGAFDAAVDAWRRHEHAIRNATAELTGTERQQAERNLLNAEANASLARLALTGDNREANGTWQRLEAAGHLESRVYLVIRDLASPAPESGFSVDSAAGDLANAHPPGQWLDDVRITFAEGMASSHVWLTNWFHRAWEVSTRIGDPFTCPTEDGARRSREAARMLLARGEHRVGDQLQVAATLFGWPFAGADHSWRMLEEARYEEAVDVHARAESALRDRLEFVRAHEPDAVGQWEFELANYRSNVALCRLAMGGGESWSAQVWQSGSATGHIESIFYPAVLALRSGDQQEAQRIVHSMSAEQLDEMTQTAMTGARSTSAFWRDWSLDGLRLLAPAEGIASTRLDDGLKKVGLSMEKGYEVSAQGVDGRAAGPASTSQEFRFCPSCGETRVPGGRFCASCGYGYP